MNATAWHAGPRIGFDLETTGVDVFADRVVTACLVGVQPGQRPIVSSWLVNPGVDIPAAATAIHGITNKRAGAGSPPPQALDEVSGHLALAMRRGVPVIGYNLAYDLSLLEAENTRHGVPTLAERLAPAEVGPCVDGRVLDQHLDKYREGKRQLTHVCDHYGVALTGAHDSGSDALAAVRLATVIATRFVDDLGGMDVWDLHRAQVGWHAEKQADFAEYLRRKGEDASDVDGSWPIRSKTPAEVA